MRELREEAAIELADPAELVKFSRWITPRRSASRFDTHFFLAALPAGQEPRGRRRGVRRSRLVHAQGALDAHAAGQILLVFPTIKHLEQLSEFATVADLLAYAARARGPADRAAWSC